MEKKIEPISEEQAFIRPIPEIHSVAELISHIWLENGHDKKLKGLELNLTIESPENWKSNDELKKIG